MTEKTIEYYYLEKRTETRGAGVIVNASVMQCGLCGSMITGTGGHSNAVCIPCGDLVRSGQARSCIDWSDSEESK